MHYVYGFLNHLRAVRRWSAAHEAHLDLDPSTLQLVVTSGDRRITMVPRFVFPGPDGVAVYSFEFKESAGFIGWLPYQLRTWPIATDKIIFKRYCEQAGLRVPAAWAAPAQATRDFIVKPRDGSFGRGIRGPFMPSAPEAWGHLATQEYCEQFVDGKAVKLWFWNDGPVAMEVISRPHIVGDGRRTLQQIAQEARGSFDRRHDLTELVDMLAWQGCSADTIVERGRRVDLDFKYATPFDPIDHSNRDVLEQQAQATKDELRRIGRALTASIPPQHEGGSIYTVDGVLDAVGDLWLLEMNCNPSVHPAAYSAMLDDLFQLEAALVE